MALSPENEIAILREYVPDGLRDLMAGIREGLDAAHIQVTGAIRNPNADLVQQIRGQRAALRAFLGHPSFDATLDALQPPRDPLLEASDVATRMSRREFKKAGDKVEEFAALGAVTRVFALTRALEN